MVNAPEIENAVLPKEEEVALQGAIRQVIFKADTGSSEIEFELGTEQA